MRIKPSVRAVARSHIGEVRQTNEDRVLNCTEHRLWAIADGMGGHSMGDVAADIVVNSLSAMAFENRQISKASIDEALNLANARVLALDGQSKNRSGSTVAGLHLDGNKALIFWAGDSRVYRRRNAVVELLTHDHRAVQEMIDAGLINVEQGRRHPQAAVITRAVGALQTLSLAWRIEQAITGDIYLICSDGLSDMVDANDIEHAMALSDCHAADQLIKLALEAGGSDNISLLLVSFGVEDVESAETNRSTALSTRCG